MDYSSEPTASNIRRPSMSGIKHNLLEKHGPHCAYCGIDLTLGQIEVDSFLPFRSNPDPSNPDNYVLSCSQCNRIKGAKEPFSSEGKERIIHPYSDRYWNEIQIGRDGIAIGKTEAGSSTISLLGLNRLELVSYRKDHIADFIRKINDDNTAYEVYTSSINQVKELLKMDIPTPELQEYFNRMIYANVIASMEAYLSKTFITIVLNDDAIFWRFVNRFDWGKEKIEIEKIKDVYDNMPIRVQTKLTEVLYHNLPKVRAMYQKILEIDILQEEANMTFLSKSVDIRHDLVHRNGRKNSNCTTDEFHSISVDMISELIEHVDRLVKEVEDQRVAL